MPAEPSNLQAARIQINQRGAEMRLSYKEKFFIMHIMQEYLKGFVVGKKDQLIVNKIINKFQGEL